jgi:hypothetical protein
MSQPEDFPPMVFMSVANKPGARVASIRELTPMFHRPPDRVGGMLPCRMQTVLGDRSPPTPQSRPTVAETATHCHRRPVSGQHALNSPSRIYRQARATLYAWCSWHTS